MATPKLRFKDFGEDWTAKKLSQVANLTSSKRVHLSDYVSEGIPFFRGKEITELKSGIFPKDILYISKKQYEDFKEKFGAPQNNEILMTAVGTLANTYLINTDFEFYFKDGNLIWFKDINADPNFLMILLDARKNDVLASAIGSTQKALTIANLNKLIFNFPSNEEQTKIASFLSNVDEKISQLTQKHELLGQYKQGMMQKLFSQQLRFKADDGSEFGEWEETTLGKVVNFQNGKRVPLSESDRQKRQGKYRYYGASGVIDHIDDYIFDGQYILIGEDGANIITRSSPLAFIVEGQFWVNNHAHIFQSKNGSNVFLAAYLESLNYEKFNSGTAQPKLNLDNLKKVPVINPCLDEQTKIANFLSAIDQKIEVVAQQIEQAKTWKKGLLQQMFV